MRTFACTVLLAMLLANAAAADSRSDVIPMDHWAYAAMDNLSDIGLLGGDSAGYWNVECILLEYPFSPGRTGDEFAEGLEQIIKQYEQEVVSLDHWAYHTLAYFVETGLLPPALQSTFDENHQLSVYEFRQLLLLAVSITLM